MPAMNPSDDWASLASEIGADFEDEAGGQMSMREAMAMLHKGVRGLMAEEAKRLAPPPIEFPELDVSSVADAVRASQANMAALVRAVQGLKLQVNQAAPNITMPKLDIPAPVVNVPAPVVNVAAPQMSRSGWRFEFVRGRDGLVESIRAIPE